MKWRLILPVVALLGMVCMLPQAAWSHHCHHHRWMMNQSMMNGGYPMGGGMSPFSRFGNYGNYGNYGAYGYGASPYSGMYGSPYGGYNNGGMMNAFGRVLRGF